MSAEGSLVRIRRLAPLVPVACALIAWAPLLDNYFNGDDFVHLYDIATRPLARLLVAVWAGHLLVVPTTVLYGMFRLFGADPRPYFWSMLLTHALNTALLYQVIRRFAASIALASFGATLWGSSPVLEGALGWYAVYGQVLLTAIVLGVLSSLGHRIAVGAPVSTRTAVCWAGLLVIGTMCFGIGLGVAMAFPLVVALALPRRQLPVRSFVVLLAGAAASYALYRLVITYSFDASGPGAELFSVTGAVGALPTVLTFAAHLFGFGAAALGFDFVGASQRYPAWMQAVGGVTLTLLVAIGGLCGSGAARRRMLALVLLAAAAYGTIAAGRAVLFVASHIPPWIAAMGSRYQYLALAVIAVLVCTALAQVADRGRTASAVVLGTATVLTAVRIAVLAIRPFPIDHWNVQRAETTAMLEEIHQRIASTPPGQVALIENQPFGLSRGFPALFPGWAGMFVVFFPDDTVDGRPVRFLVSEDDWQRSQARGGRIAALVTRR